MVSGRIFVVGDRVEGRSWMEGRCFEGRCFVVVFVRGGGGMRRGRIVVSFIGFLF